MSKWDNSTLRVAVTGAGGGCGQAIIKALKRSTLPVEIYPVDITPLAAGLHTGMGGTVLPPPEQGLEAWRKWCINMRITAIIPGSDYDLAPLAAVREDWQNQWQIRVLVNNAFAVEVSNDKWRTFETLRECGVDMPETSIEYWGSQFPAVVKPRFGMASRGLHIVTEDYALWFYYERESNNVIQEYIDGDEFTCALFFDATSCLRATFVMRRWLKNGDTHVAEAGFFPDVEAFLHEFAAKTAKRFQWQGAVNLQLRRHPERGCVVFEINARCSGSTAIRAGFGYNEPEMLLRHFVRGEYIEQPETGKGVALRYPEYRILDNIDHESLLAITRGLKGRSL